MGSDYASQPNNLITATTGNPNSVSDESNSMEGDYADEQIDADDSDGYDDEVE